MLENISYVTSGARARKHVSGSEPFALGHYAGNPIFPGVHSLQLMLDLGRALVKHEERGAPRRIHIARTQYLDMIRPGDVLEIEADIGKAGANQVRVAARISANGVLKARGTFDYEF